MGSASIREKLTDSRPAREDNAEVVFQKGNIV